MVIHGNGWDLFAWNLKKLSERAAKYTAKCLASFSVQHNFGLAYDSILAKKL